jgi:hypothetical protein
LQVRKATIHAEIAQEHNRDQSTERRRDHRKKKAEDEDETPDDRTPLEKIMDQTAPLWRYCHLKVIFSVSMLTYLLTRKPYEEQLKEKTIKMRMGLGTMKTRIMGHLTNRDTAPEKKIALQWVKNL